MRKIQGYLPNRQLRNTHIAERGKTGRYLPNRQLRKIRTD